jgi:hypothetical protein
MKNSYLWMPDVIWTSNAELNKKILDAIPRKTRSNNKWAVGVWVAWTLERNLYPETYADGGRAIPSDPNMLTNELLNYWMAHFIQECRRKIKHGSHD